MTLLACPAFRKISEYLPAARVRPAMEDMNTTILATRRDHYLGLHESEPMPDACELCEAPARRPMCVDCRAKPSGWCSTLCMDCVDKRWLGRAGLADDQPTPVDAYPRQWIPADVRARLIARGLLS